MRSHLPGRGSLSGASPPSIVPLSFVSLCSCLRSSMGDVLTPSSGLLRAEKSNLFLLDFRGVVRSVTRAWSSLRRLSAWEQDTVRNGDCMTHVSPWQLTHINPRNSFLTVGQRREDMTSYSHNWCALMTFQRQESWIQATRIALWAMS